MSYLSVLTPEDAFLRYEQVRHRLPNTAFPESSIIRPSLSQVADDIDAFVLDAFGVLNVGQTPIPGAVARMAELRERGKTLIVLTNAASDTREFALQKYRTLGFDFTAKEIVASRDVCAARLNQHLPKGKWGAICTDHDDFSDLDVDIARWSAKNPFDADAFLMLSSAALNEDTFKALKATLREAPRPLLVANPDIVAPREIGLSKEPGFYAHVLGDETGVEPVFFGKPFGDAFDDVKARLTGIPDDRIAMVGDTLHTDVLGGAAAGIKTVLITDFGLFAGLDTTGYIERSGIRPTYICKVT
jgi:HAD superfamily hydrolase (TIGR01459 family)